MSAVAEKITDRIYSIEEYLDIVEKIEGKYEYHYGKLVDWRAMAGVSEPHSLITANFVTAIANALKGKPCRVYSSDLILRIPRKPVYRFADAPVICGPVIFDPDDKIRPKAVMNPKLIVEVLSDSSEKYDRGDKFRDYREIESFEEYVLVTQREPVIETFHLQDGLWSLRTFVGMDTSVQLRSLNVAIKLADIYDGVTFPPPAPPMKHPVPD